MKNMGLCQYITEINSGKSKTELFSKWVEWGLDCFIFKNDWWAIQKSSAGLTLARPDLLNSGVDFIKVGCTAQIIEIALSICTLHLRPTFEKLFFWRKCAAQGLKDQRSVQNSLWKRPLVFKNERNLNYWRLFIGDFSGLV